MHSLRNILDIKLSARVHCNWRNNLFWEIKAWFCVRNSFLISYLSSCCIVAVGGASGKLLRQHLQKSGGAASCISATYYTKQYLQFRMFPSMNECIRVDLDRCLHRDPQNHWASCSISTLQQSYSYVTYSDVLTVTQLNKAMAQMAKS